MILQLDNIMDKYYIFEPEVAGNITKSDFLDKDTMPPQINTLRYTFDGWLGDDILESILVFVVSERLKKSIEKENLTGIAFNDVEILISEQFNELYPNKKLPEFYWLKITGIAKKDDFGCADKRLIVSQKALSLLEGFNIEHADVEECKI
ncbi:MAG: hypothetical protein JWO44_1121 [Bacteroidetes bacterium]|nr:hypothetical protein [Bacteroidota bacterium]